MPWGPASLAGAGAGAAHDCPTSAFGTCSGALFPQGAMATAYTRPRHPGQPERAAVSLAFSIPVCVSHHKGNNVGCQVAYSSKAGVSWESYFCPVCAKEVARRSWRATETQHAVLGEWPRQAAVRLVAQRPVQRAGSGREMQAAG